ncbi:MAG: nucleoside deaminase [Acidobacteria bacterium]|nr:nucleoside deaminase [Acidobacteriota bacterium]
MESAAQSWIERVIALAVDNVRNGGGGPFASLVVKHGRVLAEGVNRVTATNDPTAHAEVVAIRAACRALGHYQLDGCEIYSSCEPCPMCLGAIYWARPARVCYAATAADAAGAGFDDSHIYRQIAVPHGERTIPMIALPAPAALAPFDAWRAKTDRKLY